MSTGAASAPIVVLISGRGSNMLALEKYSRGAAASFRIAEVLSDQAEAAGLAAARAAGLAARALVPAEACAATEVRAAHERALAQAIDARRAVLIVLAGYMRILSPEFVSRYSGRILNIHPSLLPKYPGLHTHRRALEAHDTEHGATVHFVTAELDGGPAVIQARVAVRPEDDEAQLARRVQAQEHRIYPLAVDWFCLGRLTWRAGKAWLDGRELTAPVRVEECGEAPR